MCTPSWSRQLRTSKYLPGKVYRPAGQWRKICHPQCMAHPARERDQARERPVVASGLATYMLRQASMNLMPPSPPSWQKLRSQCSPEAVLQLQSIVDRNAPPRHECTTSTRLGARPVCLRRCYFGKSVAAADWLRGRLRTRDEGETRRLSSQRRATGQQAGRETTGRSDSTIAASGSRQVSRHTETRPAQQEGRKASPPTPRG